MRRSRVERCRYRPSTASIGSYRCRRQSNRHHSWHRSSNRLDRRTYQQGMAYIRCSNRCPQSYRARMRHTKLHPSCCRSDRHHIRDKSIVHRSADIGRDRMACMWYSSPSSRWYPGHTGDTRSHLTHSNMNPASSHCRPRDRPWPSMSRSDTTGRWMHPTPVGSNRHRMASTRTNHSVRHIGRAYMAYIRMRHSDRRRYRSDN